MSPRSEPRTVLLWGNRWWIPGGDALSEFADDRQAAEQLVGHFADEPKPVRLRLIYQPDTLLSVAVACPNGDRRTIAQALAGEFPDLAKPDHAWGHEPVLAAGEGFATVLHYEAEPRLLALATELARHGLAVDSAWPLATYLQALPNEWTDSGACTVVAISSDRAFAFRQPAAGGRDTPSWHGEETLASVSRWLAEILGRDPIEPILLVCGDVESEAINSLLTPDRYPGVETLPLAKSLGRAVPLPRYHPAQLLPREPVITAQRLALAASVAFLLAAVGIGGNYARACLAERAAATRHATEATGLRAEIAHLHGNAAEIAALRSRLAGSASGAPAGAFLRQVATTVPRQLVLGSLRLDGRTLALDGWMAPGTAPSVLEDWRRRLAPNEDAWTAAVQTRADGSFSLTGSFRP